MRRPLLYWIWSQRTNDEQLTLVDQRSSARGAYELPATPATVVYRLAGKEYSWQGTLTRQDGFGLEEQTRTVPCRVVVGDPLAVAQRHGKSTTVATDGPPSLMRGMFVTVQIHCQSNRTLLQVPEIGVRPGEKVWIVRNGRLEVRQARVVRIQDRAAIIDGESGDITSGDQIITSPVPNARQGLVVRVDNGGGSKVGQISELTNHDAIPSSAAAGDGR